MTWKPGESGNPAGSKPHKPITDCINVLLSRDPSDPLDDVPKTNAQAIALAWVKLARAEELAAITSLTHQVEGKPKEAIEHSAGDGWKELVFGSMKKPDESR